MPVVKVSRAGVRFAPRQVPTDMTVTVLPMTVYRVGQECAGDEQPTEVSSLEEAFEKFKPSLHFNTAVGEKRIEVVADFELTCLRDFDPKKVRSRAPGKRNDLSDLQSRIDLLSRVRERFARDSVKSAWKNTKERQEIVSALQELEQGMRNAAGREGAATLGALVIAESPDQFPGCVSSVSAPVSQFVSHSQALTRLDTAIAETEKVRDEVLKAIFRQIRPLEKSYKQIQLFFENSEVRDNVQRPPVRLFILNADTKAITSDEDSTTIVALDNFVRGRNDSSNFRHFICNLVLPGYVPDVVRKRVEDISIKWGMLLIGDLKDEKSFRTLCDQFRVNGGAYEFLKRPEDKAASDVVIAGYLKLREKHWFEDADGDSEDADLYAPASMLFAGSLARADRTSGGAIAQGPVGMIFGKIRGVEKSRIEPRISQMEHLSTERQVVSIIRNEDNDLCFAGSRTRAEDPNGVAKFFTSYRVLRYIERRIAICLRRVGEQRLTLDLVKSQVREPIEEFLRSEKQKGTIYDFNLDIDMAEEKFAMGTLDMELEVLPVGPAETFRLKIDTPNFSKEMRDNEYGATGSRGQEF